MNSVLGWTLAAVFVAAAWRQYGWQGVLFALTAIVFWLLLQFNRSVRAMKNASNAPIGHVGSAVMLHSKLKPGITLLRVITLTKSLGRKLSDEPERYEWADNAGSKVLMTFEKGRCTAWELQRPDDAE